MREGTGSEDPTLVQGDDGRPELDAAGLGLEGIEVTGVLGRGGMGEVYRGRQTWLDRPVAIKVLLPDRMQDSAGFVERFRREAKILAGLQHPHIVACYQAGVADDGRCYLVMEYVDGGSLREHLAEHGPLPREQALRLCAEIAEALRFAWRRGIIHRDVKLDNVLLQHDEHAPGGFVAKLADLGLARPVAPADGEELTVTGMVVGTPTTMAPEQFDDPQGVDHRADIYGLGCCLYHLLTGRAAFERSALSQLILAKNEEDPPDPRAARPEIDWEVAALARTMMARERDARPDYDDLVNELRTLADRPVAAPPPADRPGRWGRPVAIAALLIAAAVVFLATRPWLEDVDPPVESGRETGTGEGDGGATARPDDDGPGLTGAGGASGPIVFDEPRSFWRADEQERLTDWKHDRDSFWGFRQEGEDGITGNGDGVLARTVPEGPWRIAGTIAGTVAPGKPGRFAQCGIGVRTGEDERILAMVRDLGTQTWVSLERRDRDGKTLEVLAELAPLTGEEPWEFTVERRGDSLEIAFADRPFEPVAIDAGIADFLLQVQGGAIAVPRCTIALPDPEEQ